MAINVGDFVRGVTVDFSSVFKDKDDAPADPSGATLTLTYSDGISPLPIVKTLDLVQGDVIPDSSAHYWIASWESIECGGGRVSGYVRTTPPTPFIAIDLFLNISKNPANRVAA